MFRTTIESIVSSIEKTGMDGIHYCTIPEFGEMIFAVSPMNFGEVVPRY